MPLGICGVPHMLLFIFQQITVDLESNQLLTGASKKRAMLQSAIHLGGPHSLAAAGLLHRVPASQGTFLVPGWQ